MRALGFEVTEATCPLVRVAHQAVARLVGEGYHPLIIGKRDHVEVRGLTEDLQEFDVVLSEEDMRQISLMGSAKVRLTDFGFAPKWD